MTIQDIQIKITPILKNYGVKRAAVFGSVARGKDTENSDIDLMLELNEPLGLFKFAKLNYLLEDALEKKVDLVKIGALKPAFKNTILKDARYIYGE